MRNDSQHCTTVMSEATFLKQFYLAFSNEPLVPWVKTRLKLLEILGTSVSRRKSCAVESAPAV